MGAGANNAGLQVAANLKRLSSQRQEAANPGTAQYDGGDRKRIELQQGVGSPVAPGGVGPAVVGGPQSTDVQEQIRQLQNRYPRENN